MRKIITVLFMATLYLLNTRKAFAADSYVVSTSARIKTESSTASLDRRTILLREYLNSHNSPLTKYADNFVQSADKYNLDWRFVPAITGVESTFGKRIPYNSYNAYGWANGKYTFSSWEDSIDHVSKTLREKYVNDGLVTVDQIAKRYAPPSSTWAWKVKFFMNNIDQTSLEFDI